MSSIQVAARFTRRVTEPVYCTLRASEMAAPAVKSQEKQPSGTRYGAPHGIRFALTPGMTQPQKESKFEDLVREFSTAMLVTHDDEGGLHARPLSVASVDPGGELWFTTGSNSGKVAEVFHDRRVAVVLQGSSKYVSVSGNAEIVVDHAKAAALWSEAWRPWFPGGADDPELVLVRVMATEAELWDLRGLAGFVYLFNAVKHVVKRERMGDTPDLHHDKVQFANTTSRK